MTKIKRKEVITMANTTPNKESIRRICILHGGSYCYLQVNTGAEHVEVLMNITNERVENCLKELEAWCGMKFKLINEESTDDEIKRITLLGEKILPITIE